nr:12043_t:CDS:1 [Entrophospora candida]CAG8642232.1 8575_t:CDS:1 [Entrophospora candida]
MVNKSEENKPDSGSSDTKKTTAWVNNALRNGSSTKYTNLVEKPANLQIDHFWGTGDIAKVITENHDLSKITAKQLKNVSDKLNNEDNCFGIEKDTNARKSRIPLKNYPNDPLINEYLKKETQNGKQVIEHIKKNVMHMQKEKGKNGALTRHVGDHLNDLINKLEPSGSNESS